MEDCQKLYARLIQFREFKIVKDENGLMAYDEAGVPGKPFMVCHNGVVNVRPHNASHKNIRNAQRVTDIAIGFSL